MRGNLLTVLIQKYASMTKRLQVKNEDSDEYHIYEQRQVEREMIKIHYQDYSYLSLYEYILALTLLWSPQYSDR